MLPKNAKGEDLILAVNTAALLVYLVGCAAMLRKFREHAIILGFLFFSQCWSVISCYYNDLGIYNFELFRDTKPSFATTWLVFFYLIFNFGFMSAGRLIKSKEILLINFSIPGFASPLKLFKLSVYILFVALTFYILNHFYENGFTLYAGISRVEAYREADFIGRLIQSYGFIFVYALGFFRISKRTLVLNDLFLAEMLLYFISIGHKFSGLLILVLCYLAPVYLRYLYLNPKATIVTTRGMIVMMLGFILAMFGAFAQYNATTANSEFARQLLFDRIFASQGHIWWAVSNQTFMIEQSHWLWELKAIVWPGSVPEESVGMKYLMVSILGWDKANAIFDVGYLYTMAYPAILLATFPIWLGLVIQFLVGAFFFVLLNYLYYAVKYGYFFRSVIAITIIIPFISTLFSGVFVTLATFGVVVKLSILLALNSRSIMALCRRSKVD